MCIRDSSDTEQSAVRGIVDQHRHNVQEPVVRVVHGRANETACESRISQLLGPGEQSRIGHHFGLLHEGPVPAIHGGSSVPRTERFERRNALRSVAPPRMEARRLGNLRFFEIGANSVLTSGELCRTRSPLYRNRF